MPFTPCQEPFICEKCGKMVDVLLHGTFRNHCPHCLWSRHVDDEGPGDRASTCLGMMEPITLDHSGKHGWMLVHRCEKCGKTIRNRLTLDDDRNALPHERQFFQLRGGSRRYGG